MQIILFRPASLAVIPIALILLVTGCSGPREQANESINEANEAITEHNQLQAEARAAYDAAREASGSTSGESTSGGSTSGGGVTSGGIAAEQVESITGARETMQEARSSLREAREPLTEVQDLDVDQPVIDYTSSLLGAVEAQLAAEEREIAYYELLEQDPTLSDNREEAEQTIAEAGSGYDEAREAYARAQEIADANPELLPKS